MAIRDLPHRLLSKRLKVLRHAAGLSLAEASRQLRSRGIQAGERYLAQWENENDRREPIASDLPDIADIYSCQIQDFFKTEK